MFQLYVCTLNQGFPSSLISSCPDCEPSEASTIQFLAATGSLGVASGWQCMAAFYCYNFFPWVDFPALLKTSDKAEVSTDPGQWFVSLYQTAWNRHGFLKKIRLTLRISLERRNSINDTPQLYTIGVNSLYWKLMEIVTGSLAPLNEAGPAPLCQYRCPQFGQLSGWGST